MSSAVQKSANISFVSPGHVHNQHPCRDTGRFLTATMEKPVLYFEKRRADTTKNCSAVDGGA